MDLDEMFGGFDEKPQNSKQDETLERLAGKKRGAESQQELETLEKGLKDMPKAKRTRKSSQSEDDSDSERDDEQMI